MRTSRRYPGRSSVDEAAQSCVRFYAERSGTFRKACALNDSDGTGG